MIVSETSKRAHCCFVFVLQILLPLPPIPCTVTPPSSLTPRRPSVPSRRPRDFSGPLLSFTARFIARGKGGWEGGKGRASLFISLQDPNHRQVKTNKLMKNITLEQFVIMLGEEKYPPLFGCLGCIQMTKLMSWYLEIFSPTQYRPCWTLRLIFLASSFVIGVCAVKHPSLIVTQLQGFLVICFSESLVFMQFGPFAIYKPSITFLL